MKPSSGCPDVRILRRSNILRLIDEIPSKRFEALKEYIDVTGIEKCEKSLGDAIRSKEIELQRHIQSYAQAEVSLAQMWQAEASPGKSAEKWAEKESAKDAAQLQSESTEVGKLLAAINDLERLNATRETILKRASDATVAHKTALGEQKTEEKKVIGENPAVLELLRRARAFVVDNPEKTCPVCQQKTDSAHLTQELEKRISAMSALTTATNKTDAAKRTLVSAKAQLVSADTQLIESAEKAAPQFSGSKLPPMVAAKLSATEFEQIINTSLDLGVRLEIVGTARKTFVKEVLDAISTEVETLFTKLHPKENLGGIELSLDPDNFGSLYLHGDFHTARGVPPQSVFSESHLDTLGFCVFLALAKHYKTENTIIILDDVLTSVDAQHLDRFINLIHDEEEHFSQIIITTHYRPWCEKYRHHRAPGNKVHFIELRGWALLSGIRVQQMKLSLEELRQVLTAHPFDRQSVASKSGICLESMLEFLARMYECRLPLKARSGYTLGELTSCFSSKKLLPALTIDRSSVQKNAVGVDQVVWASTPLAPLISEIKEWAEVRNLVGCHFNELGALSVDQDVEALAKATLALGDTMVCTEGGDLPSRDDSGKFHETRSKKVRLHPLVEPK